MSQEFLVSLCANIILAGFALYFKYNAKRHKQGDSIIKLLETFNKEETHTNTMHFTWSSGLIITARQLNPDSYSSQVIIDNNDLITYLNFFEQLADLNQKKLIDLDFIDESFGQYIKQIFKTQISVDHIKKSRSKDQRNFDKLIELHQKIIEREKHISWVERFKEGLIRLREDYCYKKGKGLREKD